MTNLELVGKGEEVLDLTLTSMSFAHVIKGWKVTKNILTSERLTFRNPENTDWEISSEKIKLSLPREVRPIDSITELDKIAEKLNKAQIGSYYESCPIKTVKYGRSASFLTSEVKALRTETRKDKDPLKKDD